MIPDDAVEAAAKALADEDLVPHLTEAYRAAARAALEAAHKHIRHQVLSEFAAYLLTVPGCEHAAHEASAHGSSALGV